MLRPLEVGKLLAGSATIYVILAACSSAADGPPRRTTLGNGGASAETAGFASISTGTDASRGGTTSGGGLPGGAGASGAAGGTRDASAGNGGTLRDGSSRDAAGFVDAILHPIRDARADETASGTRLKAQYLAGSDGSRQWLGWYDSQRGEACGFGVAEDGVTRCLPGSSGGYVTGTSFADPGCTQEVVAVGSACGGSVPTYVTRLLSGACVPGAAIYQIGASFVGATYYVKSGASCVSVSSAGSTLFYVGADVPPSSFVSAAKETEP